MKCSWLHPLFSSVALGKFLNLRAPAFLSINSNNSPSDQEGWLWRSQVCLPLYGLLLLLESQFESDSRLGLVLRCRGLDFGQQWVSMATQVAVARTYLHHLLLPPRGTQVAVTLASAVCDPGALCCVLGRPVLHVLTVVSCSVMSRLFATPWTATHQASLSITNSRSLLRLVSIELMMPSNHLVPCRPLLLTVAASLSPIR